MNNLKRFFLFRKPKIIKILSENHKFKKYSKVYGISTCIMYTFPCLWNCFKYKSKSYHSHAFTSVPIFTPKILKKFCININSPFIQINSIKIIEQYAQYCSFAESKWSGRKQQQQKQQNSRFSREQPEKAKAVKGN